MIEDNSKKALINAEAANKAAIKPVRYFCGFQCAFLICIFYFFP